VPERVGSKVLPIPIKSRLSLLTEQPEALGEEQEPPRIYAGEVSAWLMLYQGCIMESAFISNKNTQGELSCQYQHLNRLTSTKLLPHA
jgi:hypothetical protein